MILTVDVADVAPPVIIIGFPVIVIALTENVKNKKTKKQRAKILFTII